MLRNDCYKVRMAAGHRLPLFVVLAVALVAALGAVPAAADLVSRPSIESESASHITPTDVTLEAQINPDGQETTYEVWVGAYPECIEEQAEACESSGGGPAGTGAIVGTIPASFSSHTVSVDVAKAWHALKPNSEYIYHVSATNSNWAYEGSAYGERKTFSTASAFASAPVIKSESVSHITPTDATLEAQLNTEGFETSYEFQLRSPECMPPAQCIEIINYPLPSGMLLGSFVDQSVSLDLNNAGVTLRPGWEYFYSVIAKSAVGTTEGSSQTFTTPSPITQPLGTVAPSTTSGGNQPSTSTSTADGSGESSSVPGVTSFGSPLGKLKPLTNAQKLARALKLCGKKPKRQQGSCKRQAHKRYGTSGKQASKK